MMPWHLEYRCRDHPELGWMRGWAFEAHVLDKLPAIHHGSPEERRVPDYGHRAKIVEESVSYDLTALPDVGLFDAVASAHDSAVTEAVKRLHELLNQPNARSRGLRLWVRREGSGWAILGVAELGDLSDAVGLARDEDPVALIRLATAWVEKIVAPGPPEPRPEITVGFETHETDSGASDAPAPHVLLVNNVREARERLRMLAQDEEPQGE